ncbi:TPA: hypothetical protein ACNIC9_000698 [Enterococcus faecium]
MDKQLYYRIMVPASLLSVCLFFVPNFPIRSVIGFLVMFGGMGLYYLLHKERKPASVYMKKTRSENKKR